ncbi:hypothetical protein FA95DRAFT_401193 [Auriscalpium vulgare]|uniref:Uncharacterized protein n=1 Tax=Auriscalpium vulgare TaxID=40419 RepID=A0ACB8RHF1_9AGAM|nr:hypothetical protein FA95DRAFT_401193 [Auriscalpium vulgare]
MSDAPPLNTPADDADRIRMKRLARLQGAPASSPASPAQSSSAPPPAPSPAKKKPIPTPTPRAAPAPTPSPLPPRKKAAAPPPAPFAYPEWENAVLTEVFQVTLDPEVALRPDNQAVWLKSYIEDEGTDDLRLYADRLDGVVIARLDLDIASELCVLICICRV